MIRLAIMLVVVPPLTFWWAMRIWWGTRAQAPDPARVQDEYPRRWAAALLRCAGVKVVVENAGVLNPGAPQILVANHTSWFDVLALSAYVPGRYCFVAKKEVRRAPFLGYAIERCGHIFIDRTDHELALQSMEDVRSRLEKEKPTVIMFAEGTRSATGELQTFKKGAFILAIQTGADIVPAAVSGSREVMRKGSFFVHSGTIVIRLGEPIPVESLTIAERDGLMRDTREAMLGLLGSGTESTGSN
jgi:1-acyl-sn-glycerol-3-phosphate acyltransferase